MEESVKERLKAFLRSEKIKGGDFCESIGVSSGFISAMRESIQPDKLKSIAINYPTLNIEWLLIGVGKMIKSDKEKIEPNVNHEFRGTPYYNVDFIGGFDVILNDQTVSPDYYIDFAPYNENGVVWCNITGKSMEPEINSGDIIAMKELTTNIEYLPFGEIYGFVTNEYRTVKKLGKSDKDGYIRLIPTNKSDEFAPQDIPTDMVIKVFSVLGSVKRF